VWDRVFVEVLGFWGGVDGLYVRLDRIWERSGEWTWADRGDERQNWKVCRWWCRYANENIVTT
jgi:hypothetical protein